MKMKIYSIFDQAAEAFATPFFMHNDGLAIRAFQDNINAEDENNLSKHPEQFKLFCLGDFDDKNGTIAAESGPVCISVGIELVNDTTPKYSETDVARLLLELKNSLKEHNK